MNVPSNGITAEVIRETMPPHHFSPDLLDATFAALPPSPPPPDATSAWRAARIARLTEEISTRMPANASQARTAADIVILRELACTIALRAYEPELTGPHIARMGRAAADLKRSAEMLVRGLERTQQKPAPFFGTMLADEVDIAAVGAAWCKRAVQPAAEDARGEPRDLNAGAAAAGMAGATPETDVQRRDLPAVTPASTNASSSDGPGVAAAGSGDSAAVRPAQDGPADAATCPATSPGPDGGPTAQAEVTRLSQGPGWTLDVVRPRPVAAAGANVVPGSAA